MDGAIRKLRLAYSATYSKEVEVEETVTFSGKEIKRKRKERRLLLDDDFPVIAEEYKKFRSQNPEPGT